MLKKARIMLLTLLLASMAAMAQTITISSRALLSGSLLEPTTMLTGTQVTLGAPTNIVSNGGSYTFLFWITPCDLPASGNPTKPCQLPPGQSTATAWYAKDCTAPCPGIDTIAFSVSGNATLSATPIANVIPANLWSVGSNDVQISLTQQAAITAQSVLNNQDFVSWLQFGGASIIGPTLTVPATQSDLAVAFYKAPPPDPCAFYERVESQDFSAFEQNRTEGTWLALRFAQQRLATCEACAAMTDPVQQTTCFESLAGPIIQHPPKQLQ